MGFTRWLLNFLQVILWILGLLWAILWVILANTDPTTIMAIPDPDFEPSYDAGFWIGLFIGLALTWGPALLILRKK